MRKIAVAVMGLGALAGLVLACVGDAPTQPDASADAPTGADGASDAAADVPPKVTFCTGVDAAFCEDFDRSDATPGAVTITPGAGQIALDTASTFSPPASLFMQLVAAGPDAGFRTAHDRFDVPVGGARKVIAELRWRLDVVGADGPGRIELFILRAAGINGAALYLESADAGPVLSFGNAFVPVPAPPLNTWQRLRVELAWPVDGGATPQATLVVEQGAPISGSVPMQPAPSPNDQFSLLVGGVREGAVQPPTANVQHRIDDVVLRVE